MTIEGRLLRLRIIWYYSIFDVRMKKKALCRLVSLAMLALYSMVYVLAPAVHSHRNRAPEATSHESSATAFDSRLQACSDCDDEESCLLCSVLHLAQVASAISSIEVDAAPQPDGVAAAKLIRPNPIETATHSRAPPAV